MNSWVKRTTLSEAFFWFCVAFLLGVAFSSAFNPPVHATTILLVVLLLSLFGYVITRKPAAILFVVILSGGFIGILRGSPDAKESLLQEYIGEEIILVGKVETTPVVKPTYQSYRFNAEKVLGTNIVTNESIFVLQSVDDVVGVEDILKLDCLLEQSNDGQGYICAFPKIVSREISNEQSLLSRLYDGFVSTLVKVYPQPEAGFIIGILVGGTALFSDELIEQFRITGTLHLVALSGFNISIIVGFLTILFDRLAVPRRWYAPTIAGLLVLFVAFVGPQASIVRAAIMGFLVVVARQRGRYTTPRNILAATAAVMVVASPDILLNDLGFQLSFMATVGIVYISPILEKKLSFVPEMWQFREALLLALSAELMVIPLLMWNFGHVSIVSPLVNMLVGPLIPAAMLFGFVGGVLGILNIALGQTFGLLGWLITATILAIIEWFASLPLAYIPWMLPGPLLILYYLFLYYFVKLNGQAKFARRV